MDKIIAICNLYRSPSLGELTERHPYGAVTFLGRYGLMDFTLSNFANSEINKLYICVDRGIDSIRSHIRNGEIWVNNTKTGFLVPHLYENGLVNPDLNTDINNLASMLELDNRQCDYVVIAPACYLMKFDFRPVIEKHKKAGADITIVYTAANGTVSEYARSDALKMDKKGNVISMKAVDPDKKTADVSLETYVMTRDAFIDLIHRGQQRSYKSTINSMVNYLVNHKSMKVVGYKAVCMVAPVTSFETYVKYSQEALGEQKLKTFFSYEWPIYTTTHNTPPTLYGEEAEVSNSFIANGTIIKGKVINSIISRNVVVEKGAVVKNCILFTKTHVGEGAVLENVVADKGVTVNKDKMVKGKKKEYVLVGQGETI